MPGAEALGDSSSKQWRSDAPLPSFYSPRHQTQATTEHEPVSEELSLDHPPQPAPISRLQHLDDADSHSQTSSDSQSTQPPPPSLLSPAFTPPATPGTATPITGQSGLFPNLQRSAPRSVAVDSSTATGGCGSKKPRLLESLPNVECIVRARIPLVSGNEMFLHLYKNDVDNKEHLAIVFGEHIRSRSLDAPRPDETEKDRMIRGAYVGRLYHGRTTSGMMGASGEDDDNGDIPRATSDNPPMVRVHSECYTGEIAWSARCDCGEQLDEAARLMTLSENKAGGIIIYLRQEGRGIGLGEKLKAYNLQDLGNDTVQANLMLNHPADARSYGLATAMLKDLGQTDIRLLTNNPDKIRAVEGPNREIVVRERIAMVPLSWKGKGGFRASEVDNYLKTKIEKMGHLLSMG